MALNSRGVEPQGVAVHGATAPGETKSMRAREPSEPLTRRLEPLIRGPEPPIWRPEPLLRLPAPQMQSH